MSARRNVIFSFCVLWLFSVAAAQSATVRTLEPIDSRLASSPRHIFYAVLEQSVTLDGNLYPAGSVAELGIRKLSGFQQRISLYALQNNGKSTGIRDSKVSAVDEAGHEYAPPGTVIVGSAASAPVGILIRFDRIVVDTGVYSWIHGVDVPEIIYSPGDAEQTVIVRVDESVDNHQPYNHHFAASVVRSTPLGGVSVPAGSPVTLMEANSLDVMSGDPVVQVTMTSVMPNGRNIETDPTEIHLVDEKGNELSDDESRFIITRGANLSIPKGSFLRFDHVKTRVGAGLADDGKTFVPAEVQPGSTHSFTILSIKPGMSYEQAVHMLQLQKLTYTEKKVPAKLSKGDRVSFLHIEGTGNYSADIGFSENPDSDSPQLVVQGIVFTSHVKSDDDRTKFHNQVLTKYGNHDPATKKDKYPIMERWVSADNSLALFYLPFGSTTEVLVPSSGPTGDPDIVLIDLTVERRSRALSAALEKIQDMQKSMPVKSAPTADTPF